MKVSTSVILTVFILTGSTVTSQQSNDDDVKKHDDDSDTSELFSEETVDDDADEFETVDVENTDDVDRQHVELETELTDVDPATESLDPKQLESESKDTPPAEFPPPYDQSTVDSSNVAQVAVFVMLINTHLYSAVAALNLTGPHIYVGRGL